MPQLSEKPKVTKAEFKHLTALFSAWSALKAMGWQEPRYFRFPAEGKEFELIELGSTGIHTAIVRGLIEIRDILAARLKEETGGK